MKTINKGYYYAIIDGEEKIIEKPNGKFNFEREYRLLGRVPNFAQGNILNKIRRCCENCKYYECWDEEDGDYGCSCEKDDIGNYWDSYDKTDCKYFEINTEGFICDESS